MTRIVRTACQSSHFECGVLVHVKDGKVTKIQGDPQHPMSKGFICVKGRAQCQLLYHPSRLKYPLRRLGERGEGKWQRVSWDDALDGIAEKLTEIKKKYGAESIASMHGTGPRPSTMATRLFAFALGSPNEISTDLHICYAPSLVAEHCTVGSSIMMEKGPDYLSSKCILVVGGNPLASHPPRGLDILEAKRKNKAKLIVVDPRRVPLANRADLWLQIRPGTDLALILGMINVIIEEKLYNKGFVDKWCYGFDKLAEHVKEYSPEKVGEITWLPADKIREAARMYATTKPAALHHRVAVEHNINSTQTNRALTILIALTGNIDVKGGNLFAMSKKGYIYTHMLRANKQFRPDAGVEKKRIGGTEFPLSAGTDSICQFVQAPLAVEAMLTGKPYPIKALYCAGGNPLNIQNCKRVWEALKTPELYVVTDFFMQPAAELADYVLPAATWLERDECCDQMYVNCIAARQKVIEPLYECWEDLKIVIELVKRIPWADRRLIPWNDVTEYNDWRVKGMGITFDEFKKEGYIVVPIKYRKYEKEGFNTPTGKVELYSTIFDKHGYDPLPHYIEPAQSPVSTPQIMKDYPLILLTGGRYIEYFHSEGRQISQLRKLVPYPEIEIHPDMAKAMNIEDGDWVWVETPMIRGERVQFKAKLTNKVHPQMVHAPHGWWFPEKPPPEHGCFDSNINVILSDAGPREVICGSVATRGTLCKVYR